MPRVRHAARTLGETGFAIDMVVTVVAVVAVAALAALVVVGLGSTFTP